MGRETLEGRFLDDFERDELLMRICGYIVQNAPPTAKIDPDIVAVAEAGAKIQAAHDRLDAIKVEADPEAARKIREEALK